MIIAAVGSSGSQTGCFFVLFFARERALAFAVQMYVSLEHPGQTPLSAIPLLWVLPQLQSSIPGGDVENAFDPVGPDVRLNRGSFVSPGVPKRRAVQKCLDWSEVAASLAIRCPREAGVYRGTHGNVFLTFQVTAPVLGWSGELEAVKLVRSPWRSVATGNGRK